MALFLRVIFITACLLACVESVCIESVWAIREAGSFEGRPYLLSLPPGKPKQLAVHLHGLSARPLDSERHIHDALVDRFTHQRATAVLMPSGDTIYGPGAGQLLGWDTHAVGAEIRYIQRLTDHVGKQHGPLPAATHMTGFSNGAFLISYAIQKNKLMPSLRLGLLAGGSRLRRTEISDRQRSQTVRVQVGSSDPYRDNVVTLRDIIHRTGAIEDFQYREVAGDHAISGRVFLDFLDWYLK